MIIVGEARSFRNRSVARPKLRGATRIDKAAAAEKNPSDGKPRGRWKRHSRVAAATALDFSRAALHRCVRVSDDRNHRKTKKFFFPSLLVCNKTCVVVIQCYRRRNHCGRR